MLCIYATDIIMYIMGIYENILENTDWIFTQFSKLYWETLNTKTYTFSKVYRADFEHLYIYCYKNNTNANSKLVLYTFGSLTACGFYDLHKKLYSSSASI